MRTSLFRIGVGSLGLRRARRTKDVFVGRMGGVVVAILTTATIVRKRVALKVVLTIRCVVKRLGTPIRRLVGFLCSLRSIGVDLRHVGRVRRVRGRRGGGRTLGTFRSQSGDLSFGGTSFGCSPRGPGGALSKVGVAVPRKGMATVIKADKDKGAAVVGLLLNCCPLLTKRVAVNDASLRGCGLG